MLLAPLEGVLLDPLAAPPEAGAAGAALDDELDESAGFDELDESAGLLASMDTEPEVELEPDGVDGVVEPDADELELAGGVAGVVEPAEEDEEPGVVLETARSPSLSQPVKSPAPSARDTATARVESLM